MALKITDTAFTQAVTDLKELYKRNEALKNKLSDLFDDVNRALITPAGDEIKLEGKKVLIQPLDDMNHAIFGMYQALGTIIGDEFFEQNVYYDKLFKQYEELGNIINNKSTKK